MLNPSTPVPGWKYSWKVVVACVPILARVHPTSICFKLPISACSAVLAPHAPAYHCTGFAFVIASKVSTLGVLFIVVVHFVNSQVVL